MGDLSFTIVDVFTDTAYSGNPLAVVTDGSAKTSDLTVGDMQKVAREFNLSDTLFVLQPEHESNDQRFRIFTTDRELPFSGHPTIGGAYVVATKDQDKKEKYLFEEPTGAIQVSVTWQDKLPDFIQLQASEGPYLFDDPIPKRIVAGLLNLESDQVHGDAWIISCGMPYPLVEVRDVEALDSASFNYNYWLKKGKDERLGSLYCFTGETSPGGEVRARMFSPTLGVSEDPASGAAAVSLAGLLAIRANEDGLHKWRIHQGVEIGRPSVLNIESELKNGEIVAARVGGNVVEVANGSIRIPPKRNHLVDVSSK